MPGEKGKPQDAADAIPFRNTPSEIKAAMRAIMVAAIGRYETAEGWYWICECCKSETLLAKRRSQDLRPTLIHKDYCPIVIVGAYLDVLNRRHAAVEVAKAVARGAFEEKKK